MFWRSQGHHKLNKIPRGKTNQLYTSFDKDSFATKYVSLLYVGEKKLSSTFYPDGDSTRITVCQDDAHDWMMGVKTSLCYAFVECLPGNRNTAHLRNTATTLRPS
ncbi:hypothetical protein TNCV_2552851 [Trichonephila clavipes]|nr:hypothetical protein TNCV_2552851 [Trichonephila clavipes]